MSESEPVETHVQPPPREGEPRQVDQGAFRRQRSAPCTRMTPSSWCQERSPLTPPLRKGHCEAFRPPFPVGGDEPRLFMPWLGRTSAFVSDLGRLALTNEADLVARSAGPRGGFPLVGAGRPQRP
jgi:hypothetical protein